MKFLYTKLILVFSILLFELPSFSQMGSIEGKVSDKKNGEEVIGATVSIDKTTIGISTSFDGTYKLSRLTPGKYNIRISFISYNPVIFENIEVKANQITQLNCELEEATVNIDEVKVTAVRRSNTEMSVMNAIKTSNLVVSGISSQQIGKSLDKDASEVIRRIPGITIFNGRFINVRGLSERYNNVWLNNGATPSSETDIRAFSFDVVPSSLIDNIMVYKSGSPELPLDFSGGFIKIFTQNMPEKNFATIDYSTAYNSTATFNSFKKYQGGKYDWLGFDDGTRALPANYPTDVKGLDKLLPNDRAQLAKQFNNNWSANKLTAMPDQKIAVTVGRKFKINQTQIGTITSANYSTSFDTRDIIANKYGSYDWNGDLPTTDFTSQAKQYTQSYKASILHNWSVLLNNNNKIEFRNLFSQNSYNRSVERNTHITSGDYFQNDFGNQFTSRTIYTGQLAGEHKFNTEKSKLDWTIGYSYANRNEPDKKVLTTQQNTATEGYELQLGESASPNQGGRVFQYNFENILSHGLNYEQKFDVAGITPSVKAGYYIESKTREFNARNIGVTYNNLNNLAFMNQPFDIIFRKENYADTMLNIDEKTNRSDSYTASNNLYAGYTGLNVPITNKINLYFGARAENNEMKLNSHTISNSALNIDNKNTYISPSANFSYNFTPKFLARVAYFKSVNRPEFREIAPFNYYDFTEKASYQGEPKLADATVNNFDFRFEVYPSDGETYSVALFYKHFNSPIELNYNGAGQSGLSYVFGNANAAINQGVEVEIRRNLDFINIFKNYSVVFNGSLINSKVVFANGSNAAERPMYGQSPYIINAGMFYQKPEWGLSFNIMYNVIGKRIVIVGVQNQNATDNIPDYYEQPRNLLDISATKKLGKHFELKAGLKDAFHNPVKITQTFENGGQKREEVFRQYSSSSLFSLGLSYKL